MLELILISATGWWLGLFTLVLFGSLVWASESDSFFLGTAVILIGAFVAQFVFSIPVWATIIANPLLLILYVAVYVAIGSLYAGMWRLPNYIRKNADRIQTDYMNWKDRVTHEHSRTLRDKFRDKITATEVDPNAPTVDVSFDTFLNSQSYGYSVRRNKDRVASWVLLWPAGVTWELMHKPFIWMWESVYYGLGEVFERINRDSARKVLEEKNK